MPPLKILYQDDHLIAIHKPAGLLVHKSPIARGQDETYALQLLRDQIGRYVHLLHRLDRPTSGVLIFALDEETARLAQRQFSEQQVEKRYIALVRGWTELDGTIDHPIKPPDYGKKGPGQAEREAKESFTYYKTLQQVDVKAEIGRYPTARFSLVSLMPKTGRTHQLRRHMAHLRHPIIGDHRYGDNKHNRFFLETYKLPGLFLIAQEMTLSHPLTGDSVTIKTEFDPIWEDMVNQLGFNHPICDER